MFKCFTFYIIFIPFSWKKLCSIALLFDILILSSQSHQYVITWTMHTCVWRTMSVTSYIQLWVRSHGDLCISTSKDKTEGDTARLQTQKNINASGFNCDKCIAWNTSHSKLVTVVKLYLLLFHNLPNQYTFSYTFGTSNDIMNTRYSYGIYECFFLIILLLCLCIVDFISMYTYQILLIL